jgi:hypothetical protein
VPVEDPFEQDAAPCRVDRDPARAIVVRGRVPTAKDPGRGPLTVRLRDVDFADVFQALAALGAGGFVVHEGVTGRVSLELTRATLDEALAAIRKAGGIEVSDAGPVRIVTAARVVPRKDAPSGGPPSGFALKRVEVRDLLAGMADVDPGLATLGPAGFLGRVSVWTKDAPLVTVRSAVLDAVGLTERTEEDRRIVERPGGTIEAPAPVARAGPEPRLSLRREDLTVAEFQLAGVAAAGDSLVAFAYAPTGQLYAYRPGDRLADGVVRAIETTDVLLDTEDGPLRLALPPMP